MIKEAGFNLTHIAVLEVKSWFGFPCLWVIFEKCDNDLLCFEPQKF